jgi:hypothetical protein
MIFVQSVAAQTLLQRTTTSLSSDSDERLSGVAATGVCAESGHFLKAGEIMPQGWMKEQIRRDLQEGYYPRFEEINHTVTYDLFVHQDRISSRNQRIYNGLKCWYSGEHEGYWKDGLLRMAFLSGNEAQKKRAVEWLDAIVEAQGTDGYIGIYKAGDEPNSRFKHVDENGELWTQSRIFQVLIAGYEFTENKVYFNALKKAVDCTIRNDSGNYWSADKLKSGGVSHGVGFFDSLWYLYNKTGNQKYADYSVKLYRDFCSVPSRNDDLQLDELLSDKKFQSHGAHIAEGFHIPSFIASITEDEKYDRAAERALEKLEYHLTPSGAMVCSERVNGKAGSGNAGYEYCGISELIQTLTKIPAIDGTAKAAELAETMMFNAGQGARLPVLTALSYVTTDNRIDAVWDGENDRYMYAGMHHTACCVLNGGRLLPYYIEGMWTKQPNGLTAQLYGPCTMNTVVDDVALRIKAETHYPFEDSIRFTVDPDQPLSLKLRFRIPKDASDVRVNGIGGAEKKDGYVVIERTWEKGDAFTLNFDFPVIKLHEVADSKEMYLKRGPLVYALPIEYDMKVTGKEIEVEGPNPGCGFHMYEVTAKDKTGWDYRMSADAEFKPVAEGGDPLHPFVDTPIKLKGQLLDSKGKYVDVTLVPIGCTVLRRTTFPEEF